MGRDSFTALLGTGTEYTGKLAFKGTVRIDGKFTGEIVSEGRLIIGKGATISGTIQIGELIVNGSINADIVASKIVVLHKEAEVIGTLHTPRLEMEEGAMLQGQLDMDADKNGKRVPHMPLESLATPDTEEHIKQ